MTVEQILLTGIGAVTSALGVVCKILWDRSDRCEEDRLSMREKLITLESKLGQKSGYIEAFAKCPVTGCPFKSAKLTNESPS